MLTLAALLLQAPDARSPVVTPAPVSTAADPYPHLVKAEGRIVWLGTPTRVQLLVSGFDAAVQVAPEGRNAIVRPITNTDDALAVLIDTRLESLWPALLAWAGPDLGALRNAKLAEAWQATIMKTPSYAQDTGEGLVRRRVRALMQYADALAMSGRSAEAVALLRQHLQPVRKTGSRKAFETTIIGLRAASIHARVGEYADALNLLGEVQKLELGAEYRVNIDVNRAALLAQSGRFAEALVLIDRTLAAFDASKIDKDDYLVAGSGRQFAWIKACALGGLGKRDEALAILAGAVPREQEVEDEYAPVQSSAAIRLRAAMCMGDVALLVEEVRQELEGESGLGSPLLLLTQLARQRLSPLSAFAPRLAADPAFQALTVGVARQLPPIFKPALLRWTNPIAGTARAADAR